MLGEEMRVWCGDSTYTGQKDVMLHALSCARDLTREKGCRSRSLDETARR